MDWYISNEKHFIGNQDKKIKFIIPKKTSIEFGVLISKLINQLQQNEAENLDFIKSMCSQLTIESDDENSDVLLFNDNQLGAILECNRISILLMTKLRHCWRWDDFSLLKAIVQTVGCPTCESLLEQYEQKLESKMKLQKIYNSYKQEDRDLPQGYEEMVAIIKNKDFYKITKEEYDKIKQFTSEHCGVKPYVLLPFTKVSSSSLLIVWLIPSTAAAFMIHIATAHVSRFIQESFVYLKISSRVIFDQRSRDVS